MEKWNKIEQWTNGQLEMETPDGFLEQKTWLVTSACFANLSNIGYLFNIGYLSSKKYLSSRTYLSSRN